MRVNGLVMRGTSKAFFIVTKGEYCSLVIEPFWVIKTGNQAKLDRLFCPGLTGLASPENPGAAGEIYHESVAISE